MKCKMRYKYVYLCTVVTKENNNYETFTITANNKIKGDNGIAHFQSFLEKDGYILINYKLIRRKRVA